MTEEQLLLRAIFYACCFLIFLFVINLFKSR